MYTKVPHASWAGRARLHGVLIEQYLPLWVMVLQKVKDCL